MRLYPWRYEVMAKAVELLNGVGSSVESEVARRADGVWFKRLRECGPYGWRWTPWRRLPGEPARWSSANGWDSAGYVEKYAPGRVEKLRLPNG
jgi:hypothetical protein